MAGWLLLGVTAAGSRVLSPSSLSLWAKNLSSGSKLARERGTHTLLHRGPPFGKGQKPGQEEEGEMP